MVHQAIVGYEDYVYCHDCGVVKSTLSGNIIRPKQGMYHFYNGTKVVSVPQDLVYVYDSIPLSRGNLKYCFGLAIGLVLVMSAAFGWSVLIITFCLNSRLG